MILESIVTTINSDGSTNIAPMGPIVDEDFSDSFLLRPFQPSATFENLNRLREGVLHVTDDVELFVAGALNSFDFDPELIDSERVNGKILKNCCRYFEFRVESIDATDPRTEMECKVVHSGEVRSFWGFNRAKHAILELAILATRVHLLKSSFIQQQYSVLKSAVDKTGGESEQRAMGKVENFFRQKGICLD